MMETKNVSVDTFGASLLDKVFGQNAEIRSLQAALKIAEAQLAQERTAHEEARSRLAGVQAIVDKERVLMPTNSFAQYTRWYLAQQIRKALAKGGE